MLPDGRTLRVRARVTSIDVDWGDGTETRHRPEHAIGHPDGLVTHTFTLKTCTREYRDEHPSGGLCHPTLEAYPIEATWTWTGEYDVGAGWTALGELTRATTVSYEIDEVRGVNVP